MNEPVKPAMTPEEWQRFFDGRSGLWKPDRAGSLAHMKVAIALYGQPFGFTDEDVNDENIAFMNAVRLARYAQDRGDETERREFMAQAERHKYRARKIDALLPPEKK